MQILFLIIPVALLALVTLFRAKPALTPAHSDERGITLQTVIITAVLALAAAGAGIVIYNVVRQEANEISTSAAEACNLQTGTSLVTGNSLSECKK